MSSDPTTKKLKASKVKRLAGSNINEIKKAKYMSKLPQRKKEFPKMIIEEEEIQSKKILVLKEASGKKNALGMAEGV